MDITESVVKRVSALSPFPESRRGWSHRAHYVFLVPLSLHVTAKHVRSILLLFDAEKSHPIVRHSGLDNGCPRTLGQKGCPMAARPEALQRATRTPRGRLMQKQYAAERLGFCRRVFLAVLPFRCIQSQRTGLRCLQWERPHAMNFASATLAATWVLFPCIIPKQK